MAPERLVSGAEAGTRRECPAFSAVPVGAQHFAFDTVLSGQVIDS
jgi:hypothetical protein